MGSLLSPSRRPVPLPERERQEGENMVVHALGAALGLPRGTTVGHCVQRMSVDILMGYGCHGALCRGWGQPCGSGMWGRPPAEWGGSALQLPGSLQVIQSTPLPLGGMHYHILSWWQWGQCLVQGLLSPSQSRVFPDAATFCGLWAWMLLRSGPECSFSLQEMRCFQCKQTHF